MYIKVAAVLIMIGTFGFVCSSYNKHDLFYLGEELTEKTLVLRFKPEHKNGRKEKNPRYIFKAQGYPAEISVSGGGYHLVTKYESIKKLMDEINEGDTVEAAIRLSDENLMYDASKSIRIIGLKYNTIQLIPPKEVEKIDKETFSVDYALSLGLLFIGICVPFYKKIFMSGN